MRKYLLPAYLSIAIFSGSIFLQTSRQVSASSGTSMIGAAQVATEQLVPGVPKVGSLPAAGPGACVMHQTQYTIHYPGGGAKLSLEFRSEQSPLNLAVRRNLPITMEGDKFVADVGPGIMSRVSLPHKPPLVAGTYFVAVINCGPQSANFTLTAHLVLPPEMDTVDLSFPSTQINEALELGSIPIAESNNCTLGRTQYTVSVADTAFCSWAQSWNAILRSDQPLNLYARLGQRVAVENGEVIADFASKPPEGDGSFSVSSAVSSTPGVRTYFIAVENCNSNATNYALLFKPFVPDLPDPSIVGAFFEGKNLLVTGHFTGPSSTVLFNGAPQPTKYGGQRSGRFFVEDVLIVKKGRKKIKPGESVMISVNTNSGCTTQPFQFVRPID